MMMLTKVSFAGMLVAMVGSWVVDDGRMGHDTPAEIFWMKIALLSILVCAVAAEYESHRGK